MCMCIYIYNVRVPACLRACVPACMHAYKDHYVCAYCSPNYARALCMSQTTYADVSGRYT